MVARGKSGRALLRQEGLERTDNALGLTSWPSVPAINQKNYYTDYLKKDEQVLPLRALIEDRRSRRLGKPKPAKPADGPDGDVEMEDENAAANDEESEEDEDAAYAKIIVIHPGSQNLRLGLASDALPKTVPMVIARRAQASESEDGDGEPRPKRIRLEGGSPRPDRQFEPEFAKEFQGMIADLKDVMRRNKRRMLPNSKEQVINYNDRAGHETISELNDAQRIEWTDVNTGKKPPSYVTGHAALRIADRSNPRYKVFRPIQHGWFNEIDYTSKTQVFEDIAIILEEAIQTELGISKRNDLRNYSCVMIVPDLYEKRYVTQLLDIMVKDLGFVNVCFLQESMAATYGAGYSMACVVDIGAQKTSVCCVEEGLCTENSRVNIKLGGQDVTDVFMKMMLYDHFPYQEINLNRRYDFILAEELKARVCTMNEVDIGVQLYDFHLRTPEETRKYTFKTYDEPILAPYGYFQPSIFDHSRKAKNRHQLIDISRDLYDNMPNETASAAQSEIFAAIAPLTIDIPNGNGTSNGAPPRALNSALLKVAESAEGRSATQTPAPDGLATPANEPQPSIGPNAQTSINEDAVPIVALDIAILTSLDHGARGDEKKLRELLGAIMVIGGGAQIPGFTSFLEQRLKSLRPGLAESITIGTVPRELEPPSVAWKGASVFAKLASTSDIWISKLQYDRLGARVLAYKCMWAF